MHVNLWSIALQRAGDNMLGQSKNIPLCWFRNESEEEDEEEHVDM